MKPLERLYRWLRDRRSPACSACGRWPAPYTVTPFRDGQWQEAEAQPLCVVCGRRALYQGDA